MLEALVSRGNAVSTAAEQITMNGHRPSTPFPVGWLLDGRIQQIGAEGMNAYLAHLLRLDPASRRMRFNCCMNDYALQAHCLSLASKNVKLLVALHCDDVCAAAEMVPLSNEARCFELAFSVEPAMQRCGLGYRLLAAALESISPATAVLACRVDNAPMLALAKKFNAAIQPADDLLILTLPLNGYPI